MNAPQQPHPAPTFGRYIGGTIFFSRWLQAPLYLGLIIAQVVYVAHFGKELQHLVSDFNDLSESDIMLIVLGLVDVVMIANLLIMVIIGGYETFVSRIRMSNHPDQPEWLSHVNPNVLKVKLAMAIIGISSVHLLKTFIEAGKLYPAGHELAGQQVITGETMMWQTFIHLAFIASAVALAYIDWLSQKSLQISPSHGSEPAPAQPAPSPAPAGGGSAPVAAPAYATAAPVAMPAYATAAGQHPGVPTQTWGMPPAGPGVSPPGAHGEPGQAPAAAPGHAPPPTAPGGPAPAPAS